MTNLPLLLLPGWGLGRGPFQPTMKEFPTARCIELPGDGATPLTDDFEVAAEHVLASLSAPVCLAGWSLGAMLAMACAARQSPMVKGLILIAGTPSFVQREGWPHAMPPAQLAEFAAAVATDFQGMLPRFVGGFNRGDLKAKEVTRQLLEMASPKAPDRALAQGLSWLESLDLRPLLQHINVPTLIIHGAYDPLMPLSGAQWMAEQISDARLEVFETCAHAPFLSEPDRFLKCVHEFLAS